LISKANETDANTVSSILTEAAEWLDSIGQSLWETNELKPDCIVDDIREGLYYLCWSDRGEIGTFKFQLEDKTIWPDVSQDESAFIHRIAIKRAFAGKGVSAAIINWAKTHAKDIGKKFLRIDCELRPKLCRIYEKQGFVKHSEKTVGPWHVARYEYDLQFCEPIA
jgi:GNAT superfamily N-acetyltransferase